MSDYTPVGGTAVQATYTASADITGGQVLIFTGPDTVAPSSAASQAIAGVAAHDAANGSKVTVHGGSGVLHETASTAAQVTAGDLLAAAAAGAVVSGAAAGQELGVATRTTGAGGGTTRWKSTRA